MTRSASSSSWSRLRVSHRALAHTLHIRPDTTPNVDYFNRDEIKSLVRKFKEMVADGGLDEVSVPPPPPNLTTVADEP